MKEFRVSEEEIKRASSVCREFIFRSVTRGEEKHYFVPKSKRQSMFDCASKGIMRGQIILPLENVGVYVQAELLRILRQY